MMPTPLGNLLDEVSRDHFPHPPATPGEIEEFERRVGWKLDPDLRAFYLHCNGAELFKRLPNTPYRLLSLVEIIRARVAIYGEPVANSFSEFLEKALRSKGRLFYLQQSQNQEQPG